MFQRLLIANRGEIAVRIVRSCETLGIETVAVYSEADRHARHVLEADAAVAIGEAPAARSYLSIPRLIDAARASGADAVHPGYGFLSENADFATACAEAGLTFVGPSPEVIARFGSKIEARRAAREAGVPLVPGAEPADQSPVAIAAAVRTTGLPALLKPSAGGGGKGMRVLRDDDEAAVATAAAAARREAEAAFGDGTLYVERLLERPRHVEVQIAGDRHGRVVHFGERDCSVQRRQQKVVEETPAPDLTSATRERLTTAAVDLARAAGYDSVGTVEFLVEGGGDEARFYFLELNTRLQVEHPITELVTGADLVRTQIEIAARRRDWSPAHRGPRGHAIECRLSAEDPSADFRPQAGRLLAYREPTGPGVRVDSGVGPGSDVPVHYDPLLAKLAVWGPSRDAARRRALAALRRYVVLGVRTNLSFLQRVLENPRFAQGAVDIGFVNDERETLAGGAPNESVIAAVAAAAATAGRKEPPRRLAGASGAAKAPGGDTESDPWSRLRDWRL
ncbi:MAG: ATP-grasp domain-containing protein [Acidobacteria bacterium]|nr:ATP-grasp domain-containing protein [Acidobacteriota bacterium]